MSKVKKSRFSEEQIVGILREGERPDQTVVEVCRQHGIWNTPTTGGGGVPAAWHRGTHLLPVVEVCRRHGIAEHTYYRWRHRFGALEVGEVRRLRELEGANARLKRRVAEQDLEIDAMRELLSKKP